MSGQLMAYVFYSTHCPDKTQKKGAFLTQPVCINILQVHSRKELAHMRNPRRLLSNIPRLPLDKTFLAQFRF
jgi:hypothetical protein